MKNFALVLLLCFSFFLVSCGKKSSTGSTGAYQVETIVGSGVAGNQDGVGTGAILNQPDGVTSAPDGSLWMTDAGNNIIKDVDPVTGQVTSVAGSGSAGFTDGTGAAAAFNSPDGITMDSSGNAYVADTGNNAIRKITPQKVVTTFAGQATAGFLDGVGTAAKFDGPTGIVYEASTGNLYVVDENNNAIRQIAPDQTVTTIVGNITEGDLDGAGTQARLKKPHGLTIDSEGNLYVTDRGNHKVKKVHKTDRRVETIAGSGSAAHADGVGAGASFNQPHGITVDSAGNLFVADEENHRIKHIGTDRAVTTIAGDGSAGHADGIGISAKFNKPRGMVVDGSGIVYVCDYANNRIKKLKKI